MDHIDPPPSKPSKNRKLRGSNSAQSQQSGPSSATLPNNNNTEHHDHSQKNQSNMPEDPSLALRSQGVVNRSSSQSSHSSSLMTTPVANSTESSNTMSSKPSQLSKSQKRKERRHQVERRRANEESTTSSDSLQNSAKASHHQPSPSSSSPSPSSIDPSSSATSKKNNLQSSQHSMSDHQNDHSKTTLHQGQTTGAKPKQQQQPKQQQPKQQQQQPKQQQSQKSSQTRRGGAGPSGASGSSSGGSSKMHKNEELRFTEADIETYRAPKKLQNLSGFGDMYPDTSQSNSNMSDSSNSLMKANRQGLLNSAEYVPSKQRNQPRVIDKQMSNDDSSKLLDISSATEGQTELASKIIQELVGNRYECDICFNTIRRKVAVWTCNHCYSIFHIVCAKKWAKSARIEPLNAAAGGLTNPSLTRSNMSSSQSSALPSSSQAANQSLNFDLNNFRWNCPKCRHGHQGMPNSWCFCGKMKNPPNDPMLVPHSCGELCLRPRNGSSCPHTCPLLCHPGPCPPCASMGPLKQCWCGKASYRLRCGSDDKGQSCNSTCQKILNCSRHKCSEICHSGPCSPCNIQLEQKCYCGKVKTSRTCGSEDELEDVSVHGPQDPRFFSCNDICDQLLACGNHRCKKKCHTGQCDECDLQPKFVNTCGCGKKPLLELTGGVPRNSCLDPIPSCKQTCQKVRPCGHKCLDVCHTGACSPCQAEVNLPCRCHSTSKVLKCYEVWPNQKQLTSEFLCEKSCGRAKACGKHTCSTKCCPSYFDHTDPEGYHVCRVTCNKKLKCGKHNCKQACHKGRCDRCLEANFNDVVCACGKTIQEAPIICGTPPLVCPFPCSKQRPCGHPANTHQCHEGDCPPCVIPVERTCAGGHTVMVNIPCYKVEMSCGVPCGKPMSCGMHNCKKTCHSGPCEAPHDPSLPDSVRQGCGQPCKTSLFTCEHQCLALCHPGRPCPQVECNQLSRITCECGVLSAEVKCTGNVKKVLPCNNQCESEKRAKRLAEAFGIYGTPNSAPRYPDLLLNMACVAPMFISKIERWFEDFVKSPATRHELPPLDRVQRQCVHELAKFYGLGTESHGSDERKQRAVTLTKRKETRMPSVPLTTVAGVTGILDSASTSDPSKTTTNSSAWNLESAPSSTLHIYDLHKGILTNTIHSFLSGFADEYTLQWIDDENCLAIFTDPSRMQRALNTLQPRGVFKVKPYQDVNPEPLTPGMVSLGSNSAWKTPDSTIASVSSTQPSTSSNKVKYTNVGGVYKAQSAWNKAGSNPFSLLDSSPSKPSSDTSSSSSSKAAHPGSMMMWNYGENSSSANKVSTGWTAFETRSSVNDDTSSSPSLPQRVVPRDWSALSDGDDGENADSSKDDKQVQDEKQQTEAPQTEDAAHQPQQE